jgi:hypothetical protein
VFKSQHRAKAECSELVKSSGSAEESRKFQDLEDRFVSLADNERALADAYNDAVHVAEKDRSRGAALRRRARFAVSWGGGHHAMEHLTDVAATRDLRYRRVRGQVLETASLRGQIARFLHKHKGRGKQPVTEDTPSDARSGAAALSRWDNEGGAVREALQI